MYQPLRPLEQVTVSQLNLWTPLIELTLHELRGALLVMSGNMPSRVESAEIELMKVKVSFRNELDTSAAEKTQSDEMLNQDLQHSVTVAKTPCVVVWKRATGDCSKGSAVPRSTPM